MDSIEQIAIDRFGTPNQWMSSRHELRFGSRGSVSVRLDTGEWYDHENKTGGKLTNDNEDTFTPSVKPWPITVKKYVYVDADGVINREVWRQYVGPQRTFKQVTYDEKGNRVFSAKNAPVIPFRLPEMLDSDYVVLVEGEKDVLTLAEAGVVATCRPAGSSKFEDELAQYFKGKRVYIVPDNDKPGIEYAQMALDALQSVCEASVHHLCRGMASKADVTDYVDLHGSEGILDAIRAAGPVEAVPDDPQPDDILPLLGWDDLTIQTEATDFVENLLEHTAMSVVYGPSNVGKTFVAMDIGIHVALGRPWFGLDTEQGPVLHLVMEGKGGVAKRRQAFVNHHGIKQRVPFWFVPTGVNFFDSEADMTKLKATLRYIEKREGQRVTMVIVDTLARAIAGANENSGEDMGVVVKNCDELRAFAGCHLMLIHHSGKDQAKGARGWSGLRAATDTEIEIAGLDGVGTVKVTKQRELEQIPEFHFRLHGVTVGTNDRGKPLTSCVVMGSDAGPTSNKQGDTKEARDTYEAFVSAIAQSLERGDCYYADNGKPAVDLKRWYEEFTILELEHCEFPTFKKRVASLVDVGKVAKQRRSNMMIYFSKT